MHQIKNFLLKGVNDKPILTDVFYTADQSKKPVIIYLHGFNGFKDWGNFDLIACQFATAGFIFIKFNCSHGGTTVTETEVFADLDAFGENNYTKELDDLQTVIDWALSGANKFADEINEHQLGLIGHSLGGGIVLLKAAEEKRVNAVAGWASIAECNTPWGNWPQERIIAWKASGVEYYFNGRTLQNMPLYYQLYEDYQDNKERLNIQRAISSLPVPVLICHGSNDPAVPVQKAYLLKR